ncbi:c-type cytochrome [Terriglobus tenax]|uniref:c-type cytochrome n=1 Tax=Terriglobus tenax TaxID=1111115 RepID=UPI0021E0B1B4|nr:cytochrome c [Terriglobus tenax]
MRPALALGLGIVLGILVVPAAIYLYFALGNPPVAVADDAFPFEKQIVRVPLHARIEAEMPKEPAIPATDENLVAGASIYREQCASCHGLKGRKSSFGAAMYPSTPQLWEKHRNGVVGVSDDPAGMTYWRVKNGIRLTGMPSYQKLLNETQMWQVSLLLSKADKPLPAAAEEAVSKPIGQ